MWTCLVRPLCCNLSTQQNDMFMIWAYHQNDPEQHISMHVLCKCSLKMRSLCDANFVIDNGTTGCHNDDANFVIDDSTTGCHHDNLWCHQWWQSWHHDNSQFTVLLISIRKCICTLYSSSDKPKHQLLRLVSWTTSLRLSNKRTEKT